MNLTAPQQRVVDLLKENEGSYIRGTFFGYMLFRNGELPIRANEFYALRRLDLLTQFEPNKYRLK